MLRVLVADDSPTARSMLRKALDAVGATQIVETADGLEALDAVSSHEFDLFVSDVDMPRIDGLELCRLLKKGERTRSLPVVLVSSLSGEEDIERGFRVGASAYLPKPFTEEQLRKIVEDVVDAPPDREKQTVLVVDDTPGILNMVGRALTDAGYDVVTAADGREALDRIRGTRPDIILSDVRMPVMDGAELREALADDPEFASVPFLVMSAEDDRETIRRLLDNGAVGYLIKPFSLDHLVVMVEKYLSDHYLELLAEKERIEKERRLLLASIASLAQTIELRDPYTGRHSENVAAMAVAVAGRMGLPVEDVETIRTAALLHDIGKIGIRDDILLKPGKLTPEEFDIIREHPSLGAEILRPIPSLGGIVPLVLHHHERHDGKGYPDGRGGDEIPLGARILAVVDSYHAMVSSRPYREGMPAEKAVGIIRAERDGQFSGPVVDIFLDLHERGDIPDFA